MRKIYTGIDIGSDSIKIVVCEILNKKMYVLASTSTKSEGVRKGLIYDSQKVIKSLEKSIKEIEQTLGIKITEAIIAVPSNDRELSITSGTSRIVGQVVTGEDIVLCLEDAVIDKIPAGRELVNIVPITFGVDEVDNLLDPKGKSGEYLNVKAVMMTIPRENMQPFLEVCSACGVEVKDVTFKTIGDYYEARGKDTEQVVGAIVNIGSETTNISIFNKGIMIKDDIINLGSKNIDKDILYAYGIELSTARALKENFAVCSRKYADNNDVVEIPINGEEKLKINQYELSEIVEARVSELLKLAKKSINNLTNRKISYIIITGGITELTGFGYVVENVLGIHASTLNMTTFGVRNNKYSSTTGMIKYLYEKLKLKEIEYSMVDDEKIELLMNNKKNLLNSNSETIVSKIFDYFTGN